MISDLLSDTRFEFGDERLCGFVNVESGSVETCRLISGKWPAKHQENLLKGN